MIRYTLITTPQANNCVPYATIKSLLRCPSNEASLRHQCPPTPQLQVPPATSVTLKVPTFPVPLVIQLGVGLVGPYAVGSATEMANGGLTIDLKMYVQRRGLGEKYDLMSNFRATKIFL